MARRLRKLGLLLALFVAWQSAAAAPDMTIDYRIHDGVTSRGVAAMGAPPSVRGWDRRTLFISGERIAEYTFGSLPGPDGVEAMAKVRVQTPRWLALFDPTSGIGTREARPSTPDLSGLVASSDTAEMIARTQLLQHLGPGVGARSFAGRSCELFRPEPTYVKAELCIGSIGGRRVVLFSRWYEMETVWMEEARTVDVGTPIPDEKFRVPASVSGGEEP